MGETKVILKYHRADNSWLCPECDSENQLTRGSCSVCGHKTVGRVAILKAWDKSEERAPVHMGEHSMGHKPPTGEPWVSPGGYRSIPVEKEPHYGRVFLWTVAIVAAIIFVCFVIYNLPW